MNPPATAALSGPLPAKAAISFGLAIFLRLALISAAQTPTNSLPVLTNVQQVVEFGAERARVEHPPVRLEGVVTFLTRRADEMFIHDAAAGVVVRHTNILESRFAGQSVRVSGELQAGLLAPFINRAQVEVLGTAPMPAPLRVPLERLHAGESAARWVEVRGVVRDVVQEEDFFIVSIRSGGSRIPAFIMGARDRKLPVEWLDSDIVLQGVSWPEVDREGKHIGTWINVATTELARIAPPALPDIFNQPVLPIGASPQLKRQSDVRRKVVGTVLYHSPAGRVYLRDETGAAQAELLVPLVRSTAWAKLVPRAPMPRLQPGQRIELAGAPLDAPFAPQLIDAEFHLLDKTPVAPQSTTITAKSALSGKFDGELVTVRAKIVGRDSRSVGRVRHEILSLEDRGTFFEAIWETPGTDSLPPATGSTIAEVTGICSVHALSSGALRNFHLVLREPSGVRLLGTVPWWASLQPGRILAVSGALGALALAWIGLLRRQIDHRKDAEAATRMINYFATSLLERNTEEEILWDLARNCVSQLGFVDCVIYLLDENQNLLVQKAAFGPKNPAEQQILNPLTIPLGQGVVGSVAATGRAEVIADTRKDPRYILDDAFRLSELAVPITANNQVLGVIDSEHPAKDFFTRKHLEALTTITSLCANKLVRVRAEERMRALNTRLEQRVAHRTTELTVSNEQLKREIEERQAAQAHLARFKAVAEATSDMVAMAAIDGAMLFINQAGRRMLGLALESDVTQLNVAHFYPARVNERFEKEGFPTALRDGAWSAEVAVLHRDGHEIPVSLVGLILRSPGGQPEFMACVIRDITEMKRAEAELLQGMAREKELNELKSRFVSMVSHEFRTPLGIITSSAEILDAYLDRLSPDERRSNLRDITDATRHMSRMMEEVLLLGRVEAGKMTCRPAPLDLAVFGQRLVDEVTSATNSRCPIHFTAPPGLAEAQADEGLLRHVFTNLLNNAAKYSPVGSLVEFQFEVRGPLAVFTVRDRGIGIPEADARLLFQAFHRGRNVGDTPGTGLGMTIVKRCVELHGGRIAFESKEGHGTTFTVALPLFGRSPAPTPTLTPTPTPTPTLI